MGLDSIKPLYDQACDWLLETQYPRHARCMHMPNLQTSYTCSHVDTHHCHLISNPALLWKLSVSWRKCWSPLWVRKKYMTYFSCIPNNIVLKHQIFNHVNASERNACHQSCSTQNLVKFNSQVQLCGPECWVTRIEVGFWPVLPINIDAQLTISEV